VFPSTFLFGQNSRLFTPYLVNSVFSLIFAEFFELYLRSSLRNINLCAVISLSALGTFEPRIFSLFRLSHISPMLKFSLRSLF
jgi:hypothetical protein